MTYVDAEARQNLLDEVASAIDELAVALAALGDAYDQLDERSADTLENELFRPIQTAYGRAKRTHAEFAARHGLRGRGFEPTAPGVPSSAVAALLEAATDSGARAEMVLSELQDSMLPVEVGDPELRAGLAEVRDRIGGLTAAAREFMRGVGR